MGYGVGKPAKRSQQPDHNLFAVKFTFLPRLWALTTYSNKSDPSKPLDENLYYSIIGDSFLLIIIINRAKPTATRKVNEGGGCCVWQRGKCIIDFISDPVDLSSGRRHPSRTILADTKRSLSIIVIVKNISHVWHVPVPVWCASIGFEC